MERPFTIIGFTMFASLIFVSILGYKSAIVLLAVCAFLLPICFSFKKIRKGKVIIAALITVLISSSLYLGFYYYSYQPQMSLCGEEVSAKAEICDSSEMRYGVYQYSLSVNEINGIKTENKIKLRYSSSEKLDADYYDTIKISGKIYELGTSSVSSKLNYMSIGQYVGISSYDKAVVEHRESSKPFNYYILKYREKLVNSLKDIMPSSNAGICIGVLLGDKSYIPNSIYNDILDVGISHLICVSGLHLSIWGFAVLNALKKLKLSRKSRYILTIVFIVIFVAFCGFTRSVVRAGIMFILYLIAELILAEADSLNSLGLATVLVLLNPFNAGNIGFIFSFLSTLAIITVGKMSIEKVSEKFGAKSYKGFKKFLFSLLEILILSVCVTVVCMPASIIIFKKITFISIVANVLILPIASGLIISSGISALLGIVPLTLIKVIVYPFAFTASALSQYIIKIVGFLSKFRFFSISAGRSYFLVFLGLSAIFGVAVILIKNKRKCLKIGSLALVVLLVVMSGTDTFQRKRECVITAFALGNNVCVSIECGDKYILIDSPNYYLANEKIENSVFSSLSSKIDYLFLTSADKTEGGNYLGIMNSNDVSNVVVPKNSEIYLAETNAKIIKSDYASLNPCNGLNITYAGGEASAFLISFEEKRVLILTNSDVDVASLPKEMQNYNYIFFKGKPNNYVVNSGVDGIIEFARDGTYSTENSALLANGYNVYQTGKSSDLMLVISKNKTEIRRKSEWA